jgi:hypothetical protein
MFIPINEIPRRETENLGTLEIGYEDHNYNSFL